MSTLAVVGASGFVGSAVAKAAERAGHTVVRVRAPRLDSADPTDPEAVLAAADLAARLAGADAVVNCAGDPDASSSDVAALRAANTALPGVVGAAAARAGVARFVHVSSAVVQGRRAVLDGSDSLDAFSPYALSKADGEAEARRHGPRVTTVYRPPSVHGPGRRVTRQLARIATSPLATVAAPGTGPTPQTTVEDVADAVVLIATSLVEPPPVVHHPWQGQTTADLLRLLGDGREPHLLPRSVTRAVLAVGSLAARMAPRVAPYARRVEMIWYGQPQARSWLTDQGWRPVTTDADWVRLGRAARGATSPSTPSAPPPNADTAHPPTTEDHA